MGVRRLLCLVFMTGTTTKISPILNPNIAWFNNDTACHLSLSVHCHTCTTSHLSGSRCTSTSVRFTWRSNSSALTLAACCACILCSSQRTGEAAGAEDEDEDVDPDMEEDKEEEEEEDEGDADDCRTAKCERSSAAISSYDEPSEAIA